MNILNCNYDIYESSVTSSDGCYIINENGNSYIDFEAGVWCASLGHNNKMVNKVISEQINCISHTGYRYTNKVVEEAAGLVLEILKLKDGKCVFLSSGSEAVEFGVQAARKIMDKPYFLCLRDYFLSSYGISNSRSREEWISLDLSEYDGNTSSFLERVPFDKIGAFVFEAGNASGTVRLPPKELIKAIVGKIKEYDSLIVVDEVTTGIGRTGKWFGFEHYDMLPDIIACGKGIGNGYPVSVIAISNEIAGKLRGMEFKYAQSHQNDPLGCAVIKEVITNINQNKLIQKAAETGTYFEQKLKWLRSKHNCIKEIRGIGLMYVMEFNQGENFCLEKLHKQLFDAGFITGININANLIRFYPPLIIEKTMIDNMADSLDKILIEYRQ